MSRRVEILFPGLAAAGYRVTSPATTAYNCIAWAAGDETDWWWPDMFGDYYWPEEAPRIETMEAFVAAYGLLGYQPCQNTDLEPGFEKVAIYINANGAPTHAARQLSSGWWTSKLERLEDIEHKTLDSLNGELYGRVGLALRRPLALSTSASDKNDDTAQP